MSKHFLCYLSLFMVMNSSFASPKDIEEGYAYQAGKINAKLKESEDLLNKSYDFSSLAIDGKLPPAVICRDKNLVEIENFDQEQDMKCSILYPTRSLYKNKKQEVYSWRDILTITPKEKVMNYKNNDDFMIGVANANEWLQIKVVMLTRMYKGMLTYRLLEAKGLLKSIKES